MLLCQHVGAVSIDDDVVDAVCRRTAGNALYTLELASLMLQRKVPHVYEGACTLAPGVSDLDSVGLPNSLHAAKAKRSNASRVAELKPSA